MGRPEHIACIKSDNDEKVSLCGRRISYEFAFQSLEHVKNSADYGSRLEACKECIKKAVPLLNTGNNEIVTVTKMKLVDVETGENVLEEFWDPD